MAYNDATGEFSGEVTPEAYYSKAVTDGMYAEAGQNPNPPASIMFTNIPNVADSSKASGLQTSFLGSTAPAPAIQPSVPTVAINPLDTAFQGIRDFTTQIEGAKTFGDKTRLMLDLRQNAMTYIEKAQAEAKADIEKKIGLDQFRNVYTHAQRIAAEQPKYAKELFEMEQQMAVMEGRSQQLTSAALKENVQLQTYIKTVDKELQLQEGLAKQFELTQQKRLDKQETEREQADIYLASASPAVKETLSTVYPDLKDNPVAMAKFLTRHEKGKEWQPLVDGTITEDKYLPFALAGSLPAKMMAIQTQAKRTGQSVESVVDDMNYATKLVQNPNLLTEELKRYGIPIPVQSKEDAKAMLSRGTLSKKEQEAEFQKNIDNVEKVLAARTARKLEDITTWKMDQSPLSDPAAQSVYDMTAAKLGRKPNLLEFGKSYINDPNITPEVKAAREEAVISGYKENALAVGKGIFHPPITPTDVSDKVRKIRVGLTLDTINSRTPNQLGQDVRTGQFFKDLASSAYNGITSMQGSIGPDFSQDAKSVEDFFNGLTGGK